MKVKRGETPNKGKGVEELVREFVALEKRIKMYNERKNVIKESLMGILDEEGVEDDKGHKIIEFPEPVEGVRRITRQKRIGQRLDIDVAETLLTELELWDQCIHMVPQVDEDAILGMAFGDDAKIPEDVITQIYTETESYAFVPVRG
jgi:hypothetical protein